MYLRCLLLFFCTFYGLSALEVNINRVYTSKENAEAYIYAGPKSTLHFRLYKINDVISFFTGQKKTHTVTMPSQRVSSGGFLAFKSFAENFKWSLFQGARRHMKPAARKKFLEAINLARYNYPYEDRFTQRNLFKPLSHPLVKSWQRKMHKRYHFSSLKEKLPVLPGGFYLLEVAQGRRITHTPLNISDMGLVVKEGANTRLAYAVDLAKNQPLPGVRLTLLSNRYDEEKKVLKTLKLSDGILFEKGIETEKQNLLYIAQKDEQYALSEIHLYQARMAKNKRVKVYTDRPVYRQGHTVQFKGLLLAEDKGSLRPLRQKAQMVVYSPQRKKLKTFEVESNEFGSFSGQYLLPAEARLGYYQFRLEVDGTKFSDGFYVEQYKKPAFKININSSQKIYKQKDSITYNIKAEYYAGGALSKTELRYEISRRKISYPWWWGYEYSWYYSGGYSYGRYEHLSSGKGVTDNQGNFKATYKPSQALSKKKLKASHDYHYRIKVFVTGKNRQTIDRAFSVKMVRGDHSMRLTQKRWYYTLNQAVDVTVSLKNWGDNRPAAGVEVKGSLVYKTYDYKTKKYNLETISENYLATTGNDGRATFEIKDIKKRGRYVFTAYTSDKSEKVSETKTFWVYKPWAGQAEHTETKNISIKADKTKYQLQDVANLRLQSPQGSGKMLVTFESTDIISYQLVDLKGPVSNIKVKLSDEHTPNVYVSAHTFALAQGAVSYSGSSELVVPPENKFMKVQVLSDRAEFRPGEKGKFVIRTLDYRDKPVAAEFSLAVVDEAIYAIKRQSLPDLTRVLYPKKSQYVKTADSIYFRFYSYGKEKKLYSMLDSQRERYLADFKAKKDTVKVRKNFKDTAYWQAHGITDQSGMAEVEFTWPDNLTQWRLTAHAISKNGLAGSHAKKVKVNKKLAMRLALPRFIRQKDEIWLRAVIQNQRPRAFEGEFSVRAENVELVKMPTRTVKLPPSSEEAFDFKIQSKELPENRMAAIEATIKIPGVDSDGVQRKIPLLPYGVKAVSSKTFLFSENQKALTETIELPPGANPGYRQLKISYVNGVMPAIAETLPYLASYPYGCVEQTLSRFVPLVLAQRISNNSGIKLNVDEEKIKQYTSVGLSKLYSFQHSDGGWGWWHDDSSDAYMTAYALYGLLQASQAGLKINKTVTDRGVNLLEKRLAGNQKPGRGYSQATEVFQQFVLTSYKKPATALAVKIKAEWSVYLKEKEINPYLVALISLGSQNIGDSSLAKRAADKLFSMRRQSNRGSFFAHKERRYYWRYDDEETTAFALVALLEHGEYRAKLKPVIQWILSKKQESRWRSTKTSALMIYALSKYAERYNEKMQPAVITLQAGSEKKKVNFSPSRINADDLALSMKTKADKLQLKVNRSSEGFFLVRADWQYYQGRRSISPRKGEISLKRRFYKLKLVHEKNRSFYQAASDTSSSFKVGDLILSVVDFSAPRGSRYLLQENFLPAGVDVVKQDHPVYFNKRNFRSYYYARPQRLDDRLAISRSYLYRGGWQQVSILRADFPGKFNTMPAQGGYMYYPESFGHSASKLITISE